MNNFKNVPTPLGGLALGISSLGLLWQFLFQFGQAFTAIISSCLLVLLFLKYVLNPALIISDLKHPVLGSVLPTFCMALMIVSTFIAKFSASIALTMWLFAIVLHFVLFVLFCYFQNQNRNIKNVLPSWFIPPIGIVAGTVTFQHHLPIYEAFEPLAHFLLYYGFAFYVITLPIVLYRWLFLGAIPDAAKPTLGVIAAPASLTLAGYLFMEQNLNLSFMEGYILLAIIMTVSVYLLLLKLLKMNFSVGMSAYTFPLVISATAMAKLSFYLAENSVNLWLSTWIYYSAQIELVLATLIVCYISVKYLQHYLKRN